MAPGVANADQMGRPPRLVILSALESHGIGRAVAARSSFWSAPAMLASLWNQRRP
jgi:hypothetical protein